MKMARRKDHDQIDSELLFSSERIRSLLWGKQAKGGLREGIQSWGYRAWNSDLGSKDWLKPRENKINFKNEILKKKNRVNPKFLKRQNLKYSSYIEKTLFKF